MIVLAQGLPPINLTLPTVNWPQLIPNLLDLLLHALEAWLRTTAEAIWNAMWSSGANFVTQLPPGLTYQFGPYTAIATNPVAVATGGATLAIVLLGLRTMISAKYGADHVMTHVTGRLIPASAVTVSYPLVVINAITTINSAASALGQSVIGGSLTGSINTAAQFPLPPTQALLFPLALVWLFLIYQGIRLIIRLAYSLFRFLVALIFGPVAIILWAIPQTEWVTWFWLREFLGWGTTPLLVTACLAMAVPLATGHGGGFLTGSIFSIAGLMAAYDMVGLLGFAGGHGRVNLPNPMTYLRLGLGSLDFGGGAAAGAMVSGAPARPQMLADMYGFR